MYTPSPESHNPTAKTSEFRKHFQIVDLPVFLNKALQALKEAPEGCENTFFNTTNFTRFHVQLFRLFSPQIKDQTDTDSLINTMIIHLLNQNHSLDTFHVQRISNAENFKYEVINVFTQRELDISSQTESSKNDTFLAPHGHFNNLENFAHKVANQYSSMKFGVDDEFSAKMDTLQVTDATSDYLFSYSETIARKIPLQ